MQHIRHRKSSQAKTQDSPLTAADTTAGAARSQERPKIRGGQKLGEVKGQERPRTATK